MNPKRATDGTCILTAAILCAGVVIVLANTSSVVGTVVKAALAALGALVFAALAWAAIEMGLRG